MLTSFRQPTWEHLELQSRPIADSLELCLLYQGKLVGFSHARRHPERGLRWIDPPVGLPWAVEILLEATKEWDKHP
jgi:hypothetical protein